MSLEDARLRALLVLAVVVLAALTAPGRLAAAVAWNDANRQDDFGLFYDSATCFFVSRCEPYALGPGRAPNLNAPHTHVLFAPLLVLSRSAAYRVWLVMGLLSLAIGLIRLARAVPIRLSLRTWAIVVLALAASGIAGATVRTGQVYPVLAWPLTEAYLAARSNRWRTSAAITAVLATMKPMLLLLLAWIMWRQRRTIPVAILAIGITLLAGAGLFGVAAYIHWRESLGSFALSGHWWDGSILQSLTRTFGETRAFLPLTFAPEAVRPLWLLLSLWLLVDLRRWVDRVTVDAAWLAVLVTAVLIAPKGWLYMGWLLLGPAAVVAQQARWSAAWTVIACLLLLPDTAPLFGQPNRWLTPIVGCLYCWTWWTVYLATRQARATRVATERATVSR